MKKVAVTGIITASIVLISGLTYLLYTDYTNRRHSTHNQNTREIKREIKHEIKTKVDKEEEEKAEEGEKEEPKKLPEIKTIKQLEAEARVKVEIVSNEQQQQQQQQQPKDKTEIIPQASSSDERTIVALEVSSPEEKEKYIAAVPEISISEEKPSIVPEVSSSEEKSIASSSELSNSEEKSSSKNKKSSDIAPEVEASRSVDKREKKSGGKRERKNSSLKKSKELKNGENKKRERKNSDKKKLAKKQQHVDIQELARQLLEKIEKEDIPTKTEEKETFFMKKVSEGEKLVAKGEDYYLDSTLPFYCALKVYPKPMELIVLLQKSTPEVVFQIIVNAMTLEQKNIQYGFYVDFPPAGTHVKLGELPSNTMENGKQAMRRGLVADMDIKAGEVIYEETPMISTLNPDSEGEYCNLCMKKINQDEKVECSYCDRVGYCSVECEQQSTKLYHQFMCTDNKTKVHGAKETAFYNHISANNLKFPQMIARFLSSILAEEMEKKQMEKQNKRYYTLYYHMDKYRYLETSATENTDKEIILLKDVLTNKVPGIEQYVTDETYLVLKGKLMYNSYSIPDLDSTPLDNQKESLIEENHRQIPSLKNNKIIGVGLYKISTYIGQSDASPNVKLEFRSGNNILTVVAINDIKKGEELVSDYILPTSN